MKEIIVDGITYVPKEQKTEGLEYVIIRTYSAGVHAGYLNKRKNKEVELSNARRIWYWSGACSLTQLAKDGTKDAENCKFSCAIDKIILTEAIEIIPCTMEAQQSIEGVKEWKK